MIVVENHSFKHRMECYTIMTQTWQSTAKKLSAEKISLDCYRTEP